MGYAGGGTIPDALNRPENHAAIEAGIPHQHSAGGKGRRAQRHHILRQPPRHEPTTKARATPSPGLNRVKKIAEDNGVNHLPGAAQQQGQSPRLHGRPHGVGRARDAGGELAQRETALRHLPHADHGGRPDRDHPRQHRSGSATSIPAACPAATSSTIRRKYNGTESCGPLPTRVSRVMWRTSLFPCAIR